MNITAWNRTRAEVEHLTVRYQGSAADTDATTLRLRVERLLDTVDLQPSGLPSGAVLIVRKLESLAPLSISALSHSSQPAWAESVQDQMSTFYATAARPVNGSFSSSADSVLFADPGEMLTCLTRDLLAGNAWQRWYWQQLLRSIPHPTGAALTTLWSIQAPFVPTVLGSLSSIESLTAIQLLTATEVNVVTHALHTSFDLPSETLAILRDIDPLPARLHRPQPFNAPSPGKPHDVESPSETLPGKTYQTDLFDEQPGQLPTVPPWKRWLNEASMRVLTPQAHYLLGLGLTLYHAPAFARSAKFATQAKSWLRAQLTEPFPTKNSARFVLKATHGPLPPSQSSSPAMPGNALSPDMPTEAFSPSEASYSPTPDIASKLLATLDYEEPSTFSPSHTLAPGSIPATSHPSIGDRTVSPSPKEFIFGASRPLPSDGLPTELGGILYLIHLLTRLNLPGAWDEEATLSEHLSGWAIVEALARGLLGTALNSYVNDPIWSVLALLDQREPGTQVGVGLPQQTAFHLPAHWLRRHGPPDPTWIATINNSRLLLFDEAAGYLVVDVLLSGLSSDEVLLAEVEAYRTQGINVDWRYGKTRPLMGLDANIIPYLSEHAAWWLERVLGFVRYLLMRMLGEDATKNHTLPLAGMLLCKPGQLIAGRTHVDLHMSMEQISLPIRRVGLDRDPGWMPDLGRIVLFHFD